MDKKFKKIIQIFILLILPIALYAQKDVTQFLDIPVDGFKPEMIKKLKSKGYTINRYSEDILDEEIFHPLEGYLFPETYTFTTKEPTVDFVTRTMLDMTDQVLTELKDGIDELDFTVHEFLSFASVVERESLFDTDRPKIAGVFMHRLEDGWRLESDITVLYVLGRTGVELSFAEIDSADSPYNTYLYDGLPVGPISNISKVTMESCVNYVEMDEYFFYACPDGTVLYATTSAEHNANAVNNPW